MSCPSELKELLQMSVFGVPWRWAGNVCIGLHNFKSDTQCHSKLAKLHATSANLRHITAFDA